MFVVSKWCQEVSVPQQAASEMGVGLPQPACRSRLQTAISALVKSHGRERYGKGALEASGVDQEDEYK